MIDTTRLGSWMDTVGLGGAGERIETRFVSGGTQNEIYEVRRGDLHAALRIPPPPAPPDRDEGIVREWRIIEALDGTDVPHTKAVGMCRDASVLGRPFYLMGFVDGWSPMGVERWPAPSTPTSGLAEALRTSSPRASRCSPRWTGAPVDWQTLDARTGSTTAKWSAGPGSSSASKAGSSRAWRSRPTGCGGIARWTTSPGSCTATISSPT